MNTNLILTLIILAIAVIGGIGALIINWRKRLMTRPKSPSQAAEWWSLLDQQWQTIFKEAIGIESEPTADELVTILRLTKLDCHSKELTSLEPLQALTGLQSLNCSGNPRTSLEPLRACTGLQSLNCSDNQLTSLEPLQTLTGLQTLNCSWNQLTDLEPLHGLKSLKQLDCRNNPSLSPSEIEHFHKAVLSRKEVNWLWWSSLNQQWQAIFKAAIRIKSEPTETELVTILNLTKLDCHRKKLTSLEPLRALTGLQSLGCSHNRLTSLEPLRACLGLQTLDCRYNQLTSLEPLQALTGLQSLDCGSNQLTSLEPLRALTSLQTLGCGGNQLTSLEGLQGCTGLQTLDCTGNQLTSLEPLHGLKSLKKLWCENNPSLSQLEIGRFLTKNRRCWWSSLDEQWQAIFNAAIGINSEPTKEELVTILTLTKLDCSYYSFGKFTWDWDIQLTNLEPLRALTNLRTLDCSSNQLTSLEPLRALTNLRTLDCRENQLTNLEPLQALTGLQTLNCGGNQLTSLEPLHSLKSLKKLDYKNNPSLSQAEIERFLTNNRWCWWPSLDKQWQAIFKAAIGIDHEPTETELETILSLTQLDCCHYKELTSNRTNLLVLDCDYHYEEPTSNRLTSLEPLLALTGLQSLNCSSNQLTNLEPLRACPGLQTLECAYNQLTNLEGLQGCTSLQTLDCRHNQLTSLEPLRACPGLQTLDCRENQLTNLEGLQACAGLQTLYCSYNKLTSLEGLQGCTSLQTLNCQSNQLTSLEGLQALTDLQTLDCQSNQLTNLEGLQGCTSLQTLYCNGNKLTSLEPLHGLKSLKKLECGNNPSLSQLEIGRFLAKNRWCWWSSLDVQWQAIFKEVIGINSEPTETELETILSLTQLDCHDKELTSLEPLRACLGLQTLDCRYNRLTNLEGLQACLGLQTLDCRYNQLTCLEPLRALTGLQTLNCGSNQLTNLEPLQACPGLQSLNCSWNRLTSLEPLHGLKSLKNLVCEKNPSLSELEIERFKQAVPSCQAVHWVGSGLIVPPQVDKLTNNRQSWWSSLSKQWQAIFKEAIGINREPTEDELVTILSLTKLDCSSKGLTSLEPLQACPGLQTLECGGNQLTSLEPLRACPGLQTLNCGFQIWNTDEDEFVRGGGNQLTSLEPLRACPGLQTLDCSHNHLTSLEGLQGCTGLQTLNCRQNHLTSLEGLQGCTGLQTLDCEYNQLTSLEGLQWCTGLQTLNCEKNQLTSLEGLQGCTGLQTLNCRQNQLTSLEGLQACPGLQTLDCSYNKLTNLEGLQACPGLQSLDCYNNQLTSLEGLRGCKGLQTLNCQQNQLTSLEGLQALTGLQSLYCRLNRLTSLEGLQGCTGLQSLDCEYNQLTSLEGLQACPGLQTLCCSNDQLTSLEGLQGCTILQTLNCYSNQLTSLEGLHGLKGLKKLNCGNAPSLSSQEIERFEKAVASCGVSPTAENQRQREAAKLRNQIVTAHARSINANNHFGFRLFDQLLQQDQGKNVFMSPASVAIALAMTYNGATSQTQKVMAKTLGLENLSLAEVNQASLAMRNLLLHHNSNVSLFLANSLWLNQDFRLEPAFLTPTQQFYAANVTNADFQSPATVSNINQWVKENTEGKLGPVVQHLDPLTILLVINAIYFKGKWAKPFYEENTGEHDFTLLTGGYKRIPMMMMFLCDRYYQGHNYQAIRLPYAGSNLSMTIFLPDRDIPLEDFPLFDNWGKWLANGILWDGTLMLPRFKVEYEVTLNEALKTLGMAQAFSVEEADFSKMAKVPKNQNLYLSQVKHQTFVEVNEEGTEEGMVAVAAAATGVYGGDECLPPPFGMIVDHPFLFTIQDDGTGTVLFLGAIVEPK